MVCPGRLLPPLLPACCPRYAGRTICWHLTLNFCSSPAGAVYLTRAVQVGERVTIQRGAYGLPGFPQLGSTRRLRLPPVCPAASFFWCALRHFLFGGSLLCTWEQRRRRQQAADGALFVVCRRLLHAHRRPAAGAVHFFWNAADAEGRDLHLTTTHAPKGNARLFFENLAGAAQPTTAQSTNNCCFWRAPAGSAACCRRFRWEGPRARGQAALLLLLTRADAVCYFVPFSLSSWIFAVYPPALAYDYGGLEKIPRLQLLLTEVRTGIQLPAAARRSAAARFAVTRIAAPFAWVAGFSPTYAEYSGGGGGSSLFLEQQSSRGMDGG